MNTVLVKQLGQQVRTLYRATTSWKDVLDNPFYDKYKKKLERIQGSAPSSVVKGRAVDAKNTPADGVLAANAQHKVSSSFNPAPDLNKLMKVELIAGKSKDDISQVWIDYHKTKDCICAVMPSDSYLQLQAKATHCPMFVYPLPRNEGYEMWFAQFGGQKCYYTPLINYQMYQENAPHSLVLTHYTEFLDSKGLVLIHGEVDLKQLTTIEAQNLANQTQLYYASQKGDLYAIVQQFNHDPEQFDYKELIEQLNNFSL